VTPKMQLALKNMSSRALRLRPWTLITKRFLHGYVLWGIFPILDKYIQIQRNIVANSQIRRFLLLLLLF
jgi:hypothetical protein